MLSPFAAVGQRDPAGGFTADNPFPPRYSPVPTALQGSPSASLACSVLPISGSPRLAKVTGTCGPAPQSPGPGVAAIFNFEQCGHYAQC